MVAAEAAYYAVPWRGEEGRSADMPTELEPQPLDIASRGPDSPEAGTINITHGEIDRTRSRPQAVDRSRQWSDDYLIVACGDAGQKIHVLRSRIRTCSAGRGSTSHGGADWTPRYDAHC
jgi:hypothetical protein